MADVAVHPECPFSVETFDLLAQLKENSKRNFYLAHQEEFKQYVEKPFQKLYCQVVAQLTAQIKKQIKFDIQILPVFDNKNSFYYILEQNSISQGTYLYIILEDYVFRFGLFISDNSVDKKRFISNYRKKSVK